VCPSSARLLYAGKRPATRLLSLYFVQIYTRFAWAGCNREVWIPRTGRLCLQIGNLMMTKTNGSSSAFSDYDEPRDHLYALEAPVRTSHCRWSRNQRPDSTTSTGACKNSGVAV
jgi:hypothetical protein